MRLSPEIHLTPLEIQVMYDNQKDSHCGTTENNKLLNVSPETAANSNIPLVICQLNNASACSKESETR